MDLARYEWSYNKKMNKVQALYKFWTSFGLPAYDELTVPDNAQMPYITYSVATDSLDNALINTASLWYHSTSWVEIENKADEIAKQIQSRLNCIKLDNGCLWIEKGNPFAQHMNEPTDTMIRRILLNIQTEFITTY